MAANLESFKPLKNTQSAGVYQIDVQSRAWGLWLPPGHSLLPAKARSKTQVQYCPDFVKHRPNKTYGGLEVQLYIFLPSAGDSRLSCFTLGEGSAGTASTIGTEGRRTKQKDLCPLPKNELQIFSHNND